MKTTSLLLLEKIEHQEMLSLSWGFADGSLSRAAVLQLAHEAVATGAAGEDPEDVLEYLIEKRLVFEIRDERIRSRFAETARLLSRLRQLFPGRPWFGGARLVSDFRIDLRRRKYPRRDRNSQALLQEHENILGRTPLRRSLWSILTGDLILSSFQERATLRLLEGLPDSGTIITAGTGSGKTMAFYLPALLRVAESVHSNENWVKILAIYPRKELLKDQLSEVFARSRGLDEILRKGRRPISVGALFSSTPISATRDHIDNANWQKNRQGFVCPWFKCPDCGSDLIWLNVDINHQSETLNCVTGTCDYRITEDFLVLTRRRLHRTPPDILFTTTEMLNSRMSDLSLRSLFGIGMPRNRKPLFTLLDEVHTYVGTTGAQTALVLRRWRHLLGESVTWCGLSATLGEASRFFSDLTGVAPDQVLELTPGANEMIEEGAEYQVILKGDPTLQASLLSTSIQATMLVARMMDTAAQSVSEGAFGQKVFVFTDDLDVTNRLFDSIRDAEAYDIFGREDNNRQPLAALRGAVPPDPLRDADGQRWRSCEEIGRDLQHRLRVGRTTSQDAGVLAGADVIVATSTLEVGYNDERVGAVLQHKAPRNMASFLQRKGRSGRVRGMRPMTVTILSDYGRDRVTFEAHEHLFDPALPPQFLPISNQYILRMQAVFAMMDWLCADAVGRTKVGWAWDVLSKPTNDSTFKQLLRERLAQLAKGEAKVLVALANHLKHSLHISDEEVSSLLWDPPRSLVLEVIPTLARRLFRDWRLAYGNDLDLQVNYHPLPDFIPRNLFSDLSLPEVQLILPPATVRDQEKQETLPIVQALLQLAPGRVTRRFAHERGALCHWVAINVEAGDQVISIAEYAERNEHVGTFEGKGDDSRTLSVPVYRPWTIRLSQARRNEVLPTSNAFPIWYSSFEGRGTPVSVATPSRSPWRDYVTEVRFFLHRFRGSVAVRRFAHEVRCNIRRLQGDSQPVVRYVDDAGNAVAVGFEVEVDGFCLDIALPSDVELVSLELPAELNASSRRAFQRHLLLADPYLPNEINRLQREWLHQILISAAIARALRDETSLGTAALAILNDDPVRVFSQVMTSLFALQEIASETDEAEEEEGEDDVPGSQRVRRVSRLEENLRSSLGRPEVIERLRALAPELDRPTPSLYGAWLRRTLHETLAEAVLQACINTSPRQAATDSLVADLEEVDNNTLARVWITETTLGGAGVIQAFAEAFASEPRALFRAIEAALAPSDLELTNQGLKEFVALTCSDTEIIEITAKIRATADHDSRAVLRRNLYEILGRRGIDPGHAFSVSLNARILRTGMNPQWDSFLAMLLKSWDTMEARFGVSIGVREICFAVLQIPKIRATLTTLVQVPEHPAFTDAELIQVLGGLLWPRGIEIRQRTLQSYNPFRDRRVTDPALVRTLLLGDKNAPIKIDSPEWATSLALSLQCKGTASLVGKRSEDSLLRSNLVKAICTPVDIGYFQFYPVIERIERTDKETRVLLSLREYV